MKTPAPLRPYAAGFTLVEMIIVIVITGIVAVAVAVFIRLPVQGYVDTAARAELADEADTAVRRMSRDLRLALPNSVRVSTNGQYLELLLTRTGGQYLDHEDGVDAGASTTVRALDFSDSTQLSFSSVGKLDTSGTRQIQVQGANRGDYLVIYNLGPGQDPANAYCSGDSCGNRARITASDGNTITLAANPFALQTPSLRSPGHRFQIVSSPVTYACVNGQLLRYANYTIAVAQPTPPTGTAALLARDVVNCSFSYATMANVRSALVGITLGMRKANANTGLITLFHQVHVDNTP